jgi:hypothetical protein
MARPARDRQASASLPQGPAPRGGLTGSGGGMLLAARAAPSRAGGTVVIPGRPSGFEPDDRGWVSLASVIGPGTAAARRGSAGEGGVRPPAGCCRRGGARHIAGHQMRPDRRRPRRGSAGPVMRCAAGVPVAIAERPRSTGMYARRTASARRPRFLAGRPCQARTDVCATGWSVSTDRRPRPMSERGAMCPIDRDVVCAFGSWR